MKNPIGSPEKTQKNQFDLFNWFIPKAHKHEDSYIYRLRLFQIAVFTLLFINSFFNFLSGLMLSYAITAVACLLTLLARHLIDKQKVKQAFLLLLGTVNAAMLFLTYAEGLKSGTYIYFFIVLIGFSFISNIKEKNNLILVYGFTATCLIAALIISSDYGIQEKLSSGTYKFNFYLNIFISFILIVGLSVYLLMDNNKNEVTQQNEQLFLDTIFNTSFDAQLIADAESGIVIDCNNQSLNIFSLNAKEDIKNVLLEDLFFAADETENKKVFDEFKNIGSSWTGELTCIRKNGSKFIGQVSIATLFFNGKYYKKISVADITDIKAMVIELTAAKEKAERMAAARTQFLANMSHELRTPLNGIIGATNLLLQDEYMGHQKEKFNILKFSSEHMLSLVNDVLDLGKLDAGKIGLDNKPLCLKGFFKKLETIFKPQFEEKGLEFRIDIDERLASDVLVDSLRLNQVFTNLLSNALKFTNKGSVIVSATGKSIKSDTVIIEFSVEDTGIGISAEKQKIIFNQFTQADYRTTRKYGGTGLGLTISQKLVKLMDGTLMVNSRYNAGSKFYFEIELATHLSKKKIFVNDNPVMKSTIKKGMRLLVAEDNAVNMMITSRFLDRWGVSYEKAKNGAEALSLFKKEKFDLLLLDLEMPEMDGYKALDEIRKQDGNIPAIAFTAAVFDNMKQHLSSCGFNDFIQKPFRPEDLHDKLAVYAQSA